jgi:photosystem II stability/assembly factor-like uncharacterized protein
MSRLAAVSAAALVALACGGSSSPPPPPAPVSADALTTTVVLGKAQAVADGLDAVNVTVTVRDAGGAPLAGRIVSLAATGGPGLVLSQPSGPTDAAGVATGSVASTRSGTRALSATLDPAAAAIVAAAQPLVEFVAGPAALLAFAAVVPEVPVFEPFAAPTVSVLDANGNVAAELGRDVTLSLSGPPAVLGGTLTASAATGAAAFAGISVDRPGSSFRLVASSAGLASVESASFAARAAWTAVGPPGGYIGQFAHDPNDAARVYAGNDSALYRSADAGLTWTALPLGRLGSAAGLGAIAVKPGDASTIFVAQAPRLLRSTDGGVTFAAFGSGLPASYPARVLRFLPSGGMLAATSAGVYRSTDAGSSWARLGTGNTGWTQSLTIDPVAPGTMYTASYTSSGSVVLKTTDDGQTWEPTGAVTGNSTGIVVDPANPLRIHASTQSGLFLSYDGGANWQERYPATSNTVLGIGAGATPWVYAGTYASGIRRAAAGTNAWTDATRLVTDYGDRIIEALAPHPTDPNVVLAGTTSGVLRTGDGGTTWSAARTGLSSHTIRELAGVAAAPSTLYAMTLVGLAKTTDGGTSWAMTGLPVGPTRVTTDPVNSAYVYGWGNPYDLWRSADGGASFTWVQVAVEAAAVAPDGALLIGTATGVMKSTDHGATFLPSSAGLPGTNVTGLAAAAGTLLAFTGDHVYRSTDGGGSWSDRGAVGTTGSSAVRLILSSGAARAYLALNDGSLWASVDGGASWSSGASLAEGAGATAIALDPAAPDTLYAGTGIGLFKSTDGGVTFRRSSSGLAHDCATALLVDAVTTSRVYVGTSNGGVYRTTTGGE